MYRIFILLSLTLFSCSRCEELKISGLWTAHLYGQRIDTLLISNEEIYLSFTYQDSLRRIYANILEYNNYPGEIKYSLYKILQGSKEEQISEKESFMIFEIGESSLFTDISSTDYPDRNNLKVNAYRRTWKNQEFDKYFESFYKKSEILNCDEQELYSVYDHREDFSKVKLVTIVPQFLGGDSLINKIFNCETDFNKNLSTGFNVPFIVNCDGEIELIINPKLSADRLKIHNEINTKLLKLGEQGLWEPAYNNYKKVRAKTYLTIKLDKGYLTATYKH